jgi:hypothetical protein
MWAANGSFACQGAASAPARALQQQPLVPLTTESFAAPPSPPGVGVPYKKAMVNKTQYAARAPAGP